MFWAEDQGFYSQLYLNLESKTFKCRSITLKIVLKSFSMCRFLRLQEKRFSFIGTSCTKGLMPLQEVFKKSSRKLGGSQQNPSSWYSPYCTTILAMGTIIAVLVTVLLGMLFEKDNTTGINRHVSTKKEIRRKLKSHLLIANSSSMISPLLLTVFPASNSRNETAELWQCFGSPWLTDKLWQ